MGEKTTTKKWKSSAETGTTRNIFNRADKTATFWRVASVTGATVMINCIVTERQRWIINNFLLIDLWRLQMLYILFTTIYNNCCQLRLSDVPVQCAVFQCCHGWKFIFQLIFCLLFVLILDHPNCLYTELPWQMHETLRLILCHHYFQPNLVLVQIVSQDVIHSNRNSIPFRLLDPWARW